MWESTRQIVCTGDWLTRRNMKIWNGRPEIRNTRDLYLRSIASYSHKNSQNTLQNQGIWLFLYLIIFVQKCNELSSFITFFYTKKTSKLRLSTLYYHAKMDLSTFWEAVQGVSNAISVKII